MAVTLRVERSLLRDVPADGILAAVDEVGRGALAGPVAVGVVIIDASVGPAPSGMRDSKEVSVGARQRLNPLVRRWARHSAVGMASAPEIDALGIVSALTLAGVRAINALGVRPHVVLLDGSHDWLSRAMPGTRVMTRVKADSTCAAVAAASIIAKVTRDAHMVALADAYPDYDWQHNMGYAAPIHVAALGKLGPSPVHRLSWRLPGISTGEP
jgi:ribonuclease HII